MVRSGILFLIITVISAVCFDFALNRTQTNALLVVERHENGQFLLPMVVKGKELLFLIDTGATHMVLSAAQARTLDIPFRDDGFNWAYQSGPHVGYAQSLHINSAQIGSLQVEGIDAAVVKGNLPYGLLGQSFLDNFKRLEIKGDQLLLYL